MEITSFMITDNKIAKYEKNKPFDICAIMTCNIYLHRSVSDVEKTLLKLWKEKVTSPMHALHLGYGIGSFIVPLVANPFLGELVTMHTSNFSVEQTTTGSFIQTDNDTTVFQNESELFQNTSKNATDDMYKTMVGSQVEYSFLIVSLLGFVIAFVFFLYHIMFYRELKITVDTKTKKNNIFSIIRLFNPATCADGDALYGFLTYVLVFVFFFACAAAQRFYANFIRAYAIDELGFTKDIGSYLNSVFWICFSVGRFAGIIVGKFLTIRKLVFIESIGLLGSALVIVIFHHVNDVHTIWVGTVLMGFFIGPLYPTGIVLTDFHVELTGVGIMVVNFGAGAGSLISIWLTGRLFDIYGPRSFRYVCLTLGCLQMLVSVLQLLLGCKRGSRFKKTENTNKKDTISAIDNTDKSGSDDDL